MVAAATEITCLLFAASWPRKQKRKRITDYQVGKDLKDHLAKEAIEQTELQNRIIEY